MRKTEATKNGAQPKDELPPQANLATLAALLLPAEARGPGDPNHKSKFMDAAISDAIHLWYRARLARAELSKLPDFEVIWKLGAGDAISKYLDLVIHPAIEAGSIEFRPDEPIDKFRRTLIDDYGLPFKGVTRLKTAMKKWLSETNQNETISSLLRDSKRTDADGRTFHAITARTLEEFGKYWKNRDSRMALARKRKERGAKQVPVTTPKKRKITTLLTDGLA
jgi:hypothetical protein